VRVEIDEGKGLHALLPPTPEQAEIAIPATTPPFEPGFRQPTTVKRLPAGPIEIACATCAPREKTLVPMDGRMTLGHSFLIHKFDFTQHEMRVHFVDIREAPFGATSIYAADVVTPWDNVISVHRVFEPDRGLGVKLLLSALAGGTLGGVALGDGVGTHATPPTVLGAVLLPLAAVLAIGGFWYALAPDYEQTLFSGR
jgi:hypothetical protein